MSTVAERRQAARILGEARWRDIPKDERIAYARKLAARRWPLSSALADAEAAKRPDLLAAKTTQP